MKRVTLLLAALTLLTAGCAGPGAHRMEAISAAALYGDVLASRYADLRYDPQSAASRALMASARAPEDLALAEWALTAALSAGDQSGATRMAQRVVTLDPLHATARLVLAADAIRRNRMDAARSHLAQAEGAPLERLIGLGLSAWTEAARGRTERALATLDRERGPLGRLLDPQRGLMLLRAGDAAGALAAFESADRAGVRSPGLVVWRGEALAALGRREEAIALYRTALERFEAPEVEAMLRAFEAGAAAPARSIARDAALGTHTLAMVLIGTSEDRAAAPYLALALLLDPTLDVALFSFTEGLQGEAGAAFAIALLEKVEPTSPYYEIARAQIAWRLAELGRAEAAIAAMDAVSHKSGRFALSAKAELLRSMERHAEAEAIYDALIAELGEPRARDWRLYFARGVARERQGRWAEAETDLKRALDLSPDEPEALNYLGYGWADRGERLDEALGLLRRAVSLAPNSGHIIDSLGWTYFKLGRHEDALPHLERAAELNPDDPTINDHLGDLYWALGRRIEARFQWTKAKGLNPDSAAAAEIERKLAGVAPARTAEAE